MASAWSRSIHDGQRLRTPRARSLFEGSRSAIPGGTIADCRYAALVTMSFTSFFNPAAFPELDGEPVEQFGVRGLVALHAEILRAFHQADAEELAPQTIHGDSRCERVFR